MFEVNYSEQSAFWNYLNVLCRLNLMNDVDYYSIHDVGFHNRVQYLVRDGGCYIRIDV
jgi:Rps23 Pro-64 3,4-dihydroxylase Tpa1-like proline 4-hydroxylase